MKPWRPCKQNQCGRLLRTPCETDYTEHYPITLTLYKRTGSTCISVLIIYLFKNTGVQTKV